MDSDLLLVIGLVLAALAIPSIVSAFADGRRPRVAAVTVVAGAIMVLAAIATYPGGYRLQDIPLAITRVVARVVN